MDKYLNLLQKGIIYFLLLVISILLIIAALDVIIQIYKGFINYTLAEFVKTQFGELLSIFLTILIGIELLEAVKAFLREDIVHVEIVVLVAIIAISRKVIVWEIASLDYMYLLALALMLIALAATYWVIKACYRKEPCKPDQNKTTL